MAQTKLTGDLERALNEVKPDYKKAWGTTGLEQGDDPIISVPEISSEYTYLHVNAPRFRGSIIFRTYPEGIIMSAYNEKAKDRRNHAIFTRPTPESAISLIAIYIEA